MNDLKQRLRGIYTIPVNDGAGLLDGKNTFTRIFDVPVIHAEALAEIERLEGVVATEIGVVIMLREFVEKERALRDAAGKGGQQVGYSPSILPSVLKNLEWMLRNGAEVGDAVLAVARTEGEHKYLDQLSDLRARLWDALRPGLKPDGTSSDDELVKRAINLWCHHAEAEGHEEQARLDGFASGQVIVQEKSCETCTYRDRGFCARIPYRKCMYHSLRCEELGELCGKWEVRGDLHATVTGGNEVNKWFE